NSQGNLSMDALSVGLLVNCHLEVQVALNVECWESSPALERYDETWASERCSGMKRPLFKLIVQQPANTHSLLSIIVAITTVMPSAQLQKNCPSQTLARSVTPHTR
ncbi:hypothetical protein HAX54_040298, partial [Datura stramonium]|nr:hypothetical protein [Datura stramonium]